MTLGNETYRNFSSFFSSSSVNVIFVRFYPCSLQISHSRWTEVWLLRDKISGTIRSDIMYSHSCLHFVLWKPSLQDVFTAGHFPNGDHFMMSWMCRTPPHRLKLKPRIMNCCWNIIQTWTRAKKPSIHCNYVHRFVSIQNIFIVDT